MWKSFSEAARGIPGRYTRIETGDTTIGVSDIEYVTPNFHGWLESKVLATSRETSTFMFKTPFKLEQFKWLVEHHNPKNYLCSGLLVGQPKSLAPGWLRWFLLPAPCTSRLLKVLRPTIGDVLQWPEVVVYATPLEVIRRLESGI